VFPFKETHAVQRQTLQYFFCELLQLVGDALHPVLAPARVLCLEPPLGLIMQGRPFTTSVILPEIRHCVHSASSLGIILQTGFG
jgi:hypothetical protein